MIFLDKIDVEEFSRLYIEIEQNFELYLISKFRFLEVVLEQLQIYTDIEKKKIMKLFKDYDENHDGVLTLNEFEVLIRNIAPSMPMMACTKLFREVILKAFYFIRHWIQWILKILMK